MHSWRTGVSDWRTVCEARRRRPHPVDADARRDSRECQSVDLGLAGLRRSRAADCVREPREPLVGPGRDASAGTRSAGGAGRRPRPVCAAVHDGGTPVVAFRWSPGATACRRRRGHAAPSLSRHSAPCGRRCRRPARVALHSRHVRVAGVLFGLAPIAHARARDLVTALKDARRRGAPATTSRPPWSGDCRSGIGGDVVIGAGCWCARLRT